MVISLLTMCAKSTSPTRWRLRRGDLLLTEGGDPDKLGRGSVWGEQLSDCIHQNHIFRIRLDPALVVPEFSSAEIASPYGKAYFLRHANQTTGIATINQKVLAAFPLKIPPIVEQRRILAILDDQLAAVERARAAAEARLGAARALPAVTLRSVFGRTGDGWREIPLGTVLSLRKDVIHPQDMPRGRATFVGLEHIESGTGLRLGSEEVELADLTGRKPMFKEGEIVYGYLRPYLNKVWVAEFDGLCSVDQYVFRVDHRQADPHFISAFMRSPSYLRRAPITTTPGQLPRIRTDEVASVPIALPPIREQKRLLAELTDVTAPTAKLRRYAEAEQEAIEALPAALLRQAFSGEL
jgi:type I restriction enzyme S subunit